MAQARLRSCKTSFTVKNATLKPSSLLILVAKWLPLFLLLTKIYEIIQKLCTVVQAQQHVQKYPNILQQSFYFSFKIIGSTSPYIE